MLEPTAQGGPYPPDLLKSEFWKHQFDSAEQGDPDVNPIYHAVGCALSAWESLEEQLAGLYIRMMLCTDGEQMLLIKRAFGSVESSATRRAMILQSAKIYFNHDWDQKEVREPVIRLMEAISDASSRRDEFAHGRGLHYKVDNKEVGAFLLSADYHTRKNEMLNPIRREENILGHNNSVYRYKSS